MHVVLLGDSIFDNAHYVPNQHPVVEQVQALLPDGSRATLLARDGSITQEVIVQVGRLPRDTTHVAVSSGGNDALRAGLVLDAPRGLLEALADFQDAFRADYRQLMLALEARGLPVVVCTIYDSIPHLERVKKTALSIFNDVIIQEASLHAFPVIDLRRWCREPADYSALSPIEPSASGGMKIAKRIAAVVKSVDHQSRFTVIA